VNLVGEEIQAVESRDKMVCQIAYGRSMDSNPILPVPYHEPLQLDEPSTARVIKGLVYIALQEPGYDSHGLSQPEAAQKIVDLYGLDEIARISMGTPGYVYCGLRQLDAEKIIDRLCGTTEHLELFAQLAD
jgi:hypothetical protein